MNKETRDKIEKLALKATQYNGPTSYINENAFKAGAKALAELQREDLEFVRDSLRCATDSYEGRKTTSGWHDFEYRLNMEALQRLEELLS